MPPVLEPGSLPHQTTELRHLAMSVVKDGEVQRVFDILDYLGGSGQAARGNRGGLGAILTSGLFWAILGGMALSHCLWNLVGPITYAALGLWALLFHFIKRGAEEAAAEGFYPHGEN